MATEADLRSFGHLVCRLSAGAPLTREEACEAYRQVILNEQPELQQGAFLTAHLMRGPTTEALAGAWDALDRYDTAKIECRRAGPVCDIVGTGSDPLKTVNCSTPAAIIAAACDLPVAKKGARLVTGVSGASDVLEILGVDLNAPLARAEAALNRHGICYLPGEAFLKAGWARLIRSMRFTSAFNIIGPLTMPCAATSHIVIGAYAPVVCDQLVAILREIGLTAALSPFGWVDGEAPEEGMDEFSPCGPTRVVSLRDGAIETVEVTPRDFGIEPLPFASIASRAAAVENAGAIRAVLEGEYETPLGQFFCLNAGAALFCSGRAASYAAGYGQAMQALATGRAAEKLRQLVEAQG